MQSIVDELKAKNIHFSLMYYGKEDYGTFWDIKSILENREYFQDRFSTYKIQSFESICDYLDYLCLKKCVMLQEMIPAIKSDEDKQAFQAISNIAKEQCDCIGNGLIIQFINKSYEEIFAEKYYEFSLSQITIELIIKFQGGINREVFRYLARNYNYLLIYRFQDFQKKFEKEPELFEMLFHKKNLEEIQSLRFDTVLPVFASIWNGSNAQLKKIISPIIETVIADMEELVKSKDLCDYRNIMILEKHFRYVYEFLMKIKHPKANTFRSYETDIEARLEEDIKKHGQSFTHELPVEEIVNYIKGLPNWNVQMLSLTHDCKNENNVAEFVSRFSHPSKGKQGIVDMVSSNISSDNYFTHSHQRELNITASLGAATVFAIWHDKELFPDCLQWYNAFLAIISEQIGGGIELSEDLETLYIMLQPVILSDEIDKRDIAPLCYGAAMFLCALTEKLLRTFYIYLMRDRVYVPLTSATLGTLLSPDNQEMVNIFGKDHLKSLSFFFCTVGDKKIGMNYRNNLAHWIGLRDRDINSMLVAKLFFLYTDVINTIFWYFCKEGWDELEQ